MYSLSQNKITTSFIKALKAYLKEKDDFVLQEYLDLFKQDYFGAKALSDASLLKIDPPATSLDLGFLGDSKSLSVVPPTLVKFLQFLSPELRENLVLCGGAVMRQLLPFHERNNSAWKDSDYDFFIVQKEGELNFLIQDLLEAVMNDDDILYKMRDIILTENALTFYFKNKTSIQIILRQYRSLAQVLKGFDTHACQGGCTFPSNIFEGMKWSDCVFYGTRLSKFTLTHRVQIPGPFFSPTYAARLYKYLRRGFLIYAPFVEFMKGRSTMSPVEDKDPGLSELLKYLSREKSLYRGYASDYGYNTTENIAEEKPVLPANVVPEVPVILPGPSSTTKRNKNKPKKATNAPLKEVNTYQFKGNKDTTTFIKCEITTSGGKHPRFVKMVLNLNVDRKSKLRSALFYFLLSCIEQTPCINLSSLLKVVKDCNTQVTVFHPSTKYNRFEDWFVQ